MGTFFEEITLVNSRDIGNAREGLIPEAKIRAITLEAMPDTGAYTLVINEEVRQKLGLAIVNTLTANLADGSATKCGQTEPVEIRWKNRETSLRALVVPNASKVLLGAIPLEDMDLCVDPVNRRLTGVHGDQQIQLVL